MPTMGRRFSLIKDSHVSSGLHEGDRCPYEKCRMYINIKNLCQAIPLQKPLRRLLCRILLTGFLNSGRLHPTIAILGEEGKNLNGGEGQTMGEPYCRKCHRASQRWIGLGGRIHGLSARAFCTFSFSRHLFEPSNYPTRMTCSITQMG